MSKLQIAVLRAEIEPIRLRRVKYIATDEDNRIWEEKQELIYLLQKEMWDEYDKGSRCYTIALERWRNNDNKNWCGQGSFDFYASLDSK